MSAANQLLAKLIRPPKLLLVEDDAMVGESLVYWLDKNYECKLIWARTGEDAVKIVDEEEDFDLIFLNLKLPGISGVDVLEKVKVKWPDLPVVIITGLSNSDLAMKAASLGVVGLFTKPVDGRSLEQLFRTYKIKARTREDERYFQQTVPDGP